MDSDDFDNLLSDAGCFDSVYVERPRIAYDFLRDIRRKNADVGGWTVNQLIEQFEDAGF